jgi:predicted TIM-barrel enzyme
LKVHLVIHYLNRVTAISEAGRAIKAGADGVFLISHNGKDAELPEVASEIKTLFPDLMVGLNLLSKAPLESAHAAVGMGLDMVWADDMGVSSEGLTETGRSISNFAKKHQEVLFFASVAFKYQEEEPQPGRAAENTLLAGFIPTTSGAATGAAPSLEKIRGMSSAANGKLAVASGMAPSNVALYAPFLSHILVATGVSLDEHHVNQGLLAALVKKAQASTAAAKQ